MQLGRRLKIAPRAGAWIESVTDASGKVKKGTSLPVRERGLKEGCWVAQRDQRSSLPVRERGLKESKQNGKLANVPIAPRAGAWIESVVGVIIPINFLSLPVRERGLKAIFQRVNGLYLISLPVRERGLKVDQASYDNTIPISLPVRERGLKVGNVIKVAIN